MIALVAFALLLSVWASFERTGSVAVEQAFTRALVGYAIARGLNGAISVAQGTEVAVQPAGVGVTFTPGEILDPINDLVERFSWIMMLAASSLGVQRVLLTVSDWWGIAALLGVLGAVWLGLRLKRGGPHRLAASAGRAFLFLVLLRLAMPAVVLANDVVYRLFLEEDYIAASAELERAREAIGSINDSVAARTRVPAVDGVAPGLLDRARGVWRQAVQSVDIERRLADYTRAAESVSENAIRLIVVFLMQTIVFPLLFLFMARGLARRLLRA